MSQEMSNVKVAVRVRPFNSREQELGSELAVSMVGPQTVLLGDAKSNQDERKFTFDYRYVAKAMCRLDSFCLLEASGLTTSPVLCKTIKLCSKLSGKIT